MESSKLSMSTSSNQYFKIENKELKGTSISLRAKKIADLGALSKAKIWIMEILHAKTYIQLSLGDREQGDIICKVSDLAKELRVSKQKVLQAEKEGTILELVGLSLEAKHQHTPISIMEDYIYAKGVERLRYLEYLADSLYRPLSELIEADYEDKLDQLFEYAQKITQKDIKDVLASLPSFIKGAHPKDTIKKLFIAGQKLGRALEAELNDTISDLGLDINDFSEKELKRLTIMLLISGSRRPYREAEEAGNIVYEKLFDLSLDQYKAQSNYPSEAKAYCSELFKEFGVKEPVDSNLRDKMYLRSKLTNHASVVARNLNEEVSKPLLSQFDNICKKLEKTDSLSDAEIGKKALGSMAILNYLSKNIY